MRRLGLCEVEGVSHCVLRRCARHVPAEETEEAIPTMPDLKLIESEQDVDEVFQADQVIVYKHSPTCGICAAALQEVEKFMGDHPEASVHLVDVLAHRDLSRRIAAKTGIPHESPQVILLRRGTPTWSASHYAITAEAVTSCVAATE